MDFLAGVEVNPAMYPAIPMLLILGYILKQTPKFPDWAIVWAILVAGLIAGVSILGFNFEGVANGVIAAGTAVISHQAIKQTMSKP